MIVSQFREVRRFMGRMDPGQDVVAGFKTVCQENRIASGWIMASAVLRNATVAPVLADGSGIGDPERTDGTVFCPSLSGNVSVEGETRGVRLYSICHPADGGAPRMGLVRAGEVVMCEFLVVALDDATLVRQADGRAGFAPWVQLQAAGEPPREAPRTPMRAPEGPAPRPTPPPTHVAIEDDEASELNILEMQQGDWVDHPRFGLCKVVHPPVDDKVTIKLPAGKHVDLHLGVMRVLPPKQVGGRKIFQVEVRRKT
ncbi:MAG: DUF296 domain-containing protein [Deltaproteobacteria bacterium]|nr:DUF296 domain-containing protein [Deltaproteobacteria bacterium]